MSQTSSTTIQATFRGRLNNSKWKFPVFASGVSHNRALSVILLDDYCPPTAWHKKIGTDQNTLQNLKKELTEKLLIEMDTDSENFLISAEWLNLEYMGLSQIRYLRDLIVRYADNILVVGYIRSPKSYMESSFQQQVKTKKAQFDLHSLYPRYRQRLEKFDEVFGKENVLFWKFDPSNLLNSCVIQDFCSRLNINFPLIPSKNLMKIYRAKPLCFCMHIESIDQVPLPERKKVSKIIY